MPELIITEKPSSAQKVAEALAEGKLEKKKSKKSFYYEFTRGKKKIYVTPAVGHLFGLVEKKKHGWTYPVFDIEWKPAYEVSKGAAFTKKYVAAIKKTPIVVNDTRGFFVNRCVLRYMSESYNMLIEGVPPVMIENAAKFAGMPVGYGFSRPLFG